MVYFDATKWLLIYDYMWETYHTNQVTKRHLNPIFVNFLQKKISAWQQEYIIEDVEQNTFKKYVKLKHKINFDDLKW